MDSANKGGIPAQARFIRRPYQFLFWARFVVGMFRLWWFNRRAAKARARRLAEVAALASLSWLILALAVRGAFALAGV